MSKTKKQKEAEDLFESILETDQFDVDLTGKDLKLFRRMCVEMFEEGYWSGIAVAQDEVCDLIDRLERK